ncbi:hypothetical protein PVL29_009457 [Vitis rotundifolia]|uniref:Retrotransposon Copia-like N-terminal domain-containing protein n=1 Tax=Vitis rotundifolia TaxID=103349 RepID=A0AA38ZSF5_VITRO|nr:hypothetical protein PVL29_009457 [Vitis rotundifolia]
MTGSLCRDDSTSTTSNQSHVDQSVTTFPSGDNNSLWIMAHKLNGKYYLQWSQSVQIVICGRGKFKYLSDEAKAPAATNPTYKIWFAENSTVHAWLINSIQPRMYGILPNECTLILATCHRCLKFDQN